MAIPLTGQVTLAQIRTELDGSSAGAMVSLLTASTGGYKVISSSTAYAPDGNSPHGMNEFRGYTQVTVDVTPPTVPNNLYTEMGSDVRDVEVYWGTSTDNVGVVAYELQRRTGTSGSFGTIYNGGLLYFTFTGANATTYQFQVRARDAAGNVSAYTSIVSHTTGTLCFIEGTLITLSNGSKISIEELRVNDNLLSSEIKTLDDDNQVSRLYKWKSRILPIQKTESRIVKHVELLSERTFIINEGLLEATENHTQLVLRNGYWIFTPFKNIFIGDKLKHLDGHLIEIYSIEISNTPKKVYAITLDKIHTYYANNILTHNIK